MKPILILMKVARFLNEAYKESWIGSEDELPVNRDSPISQTANSFAHSLFELTGFPL